MTSVQERIHPTFGVGARTPAPSRVRIGRRLGWLAAALVLLATLAIIPFAGTGYVAEPLELALLAMSDPTEAAQTIEPREIKRLQGEHSRLSRALARKVPNGNFLVIDQTHNRLQIRHKNDRRLDAVCSAGSGFVLNEQGGRGRRWVFDTPRGIFKVLNKIRNPIWKKPDWAFLEEGQPLPKNPGDRIEYGMLGEYALYFGNGYMIHGTLYENLLGRSVTHGCIRLGRDDLRRVYQECPIGTPIYIY